MTCLPLSKIRMKEKSLSVHRSVTDIIKMKNFIVCLFTLNR